MISYIFTLNPHMVSTTFHQVVDITAVMSTIRMPTTCYLTIALNKLGAEQEISGAALKGLNHPMEYVRVS
jgi:hypothetical protein